MMLVEIIAALEERGYRWEQYRHFDMAFIRNVIFREKNEKGSYVDPPKRKDDRKDPDEDLRLMMRRRNWPDWVIEERIRSVKQQKGKRRG